MENKAIYVLLLCMRARGGVAGKIANQLAS